MYLHHKSNVVLGRTYLQHQNKASKLKFKTKEINKIERCSKKCSIQSKEFKSEVKGRVSSTNLGIDEMYITRRVQNKIYILG